ncbi:F-box/LRR-repeat protein 2 isoform X2 [Anabrus simplex]
MATSKCIEDLPDEILIKIFSYLHLKEIVLSVCHVSSRWRVLAQDSELWNNLRYTPGTTTSETEIINILKVSPKLKVFIPENYMKYAVLKTVIQNCKDIRKLELYMDDLNYNIVRDLVRECKNLEDLSIVEIECDRKGCFQLLSKCSNLRALRLTGNVPDDKVCVFKPIADGCPSLQYLDLRNLYDYANADLKYLISKKQHQLISLSLRWCSESKSCVVPIIEPCKNLLYLHVEEYCDIMTDEAFQVLKSLPKLKHLSLPYFRSIDVKHMIDLFEYGMVSNLSELELSVCENFNDQLACIIFKNCQKLRRLVLIYCPKLTDTGLETIGCLTDLQHLNLCSCSLISDKGLEYITKCHKLKLLNLNGGCFTAEGLKPLLNLEHLKVLSLLGTLDIKPFLCAMPGHLKRLEVLNINGDTLDELFLKKFKSKMPKLSVRMVIENDECFQMVY